MSPEGLRDSISWLQRKRHFWLMEARTHHETLRRRRLTDAMRENQRRCLSDAVAFARLFNRRLILAKRELASLQRRGPVLSLVRA